MNRMFVQDALSHYDFQFDILIEKFKRDSYQFVNLLSNISFNNSQ